MGKVSRKELERDLIRAQQQRDAALLKVAALQRELEDFRAQRLTAGPSLSDRLATWLDDMRQAVGW